MAATPNTPKYRAGASRTPVVAATFARQMADVARAERLRSLRAQAHISRERAAGEIGVTTKTLYEWENGGSIRWENAKKVAGFYGVEPESIVARESGEEFTVVDASQLDRIEEKLDELLKRLDEPGETAFPDPPPFPEDDDSTEATPREPQTPEEGTGQ